MPALIAAVKGDADWGVREQAANSLGAIGPKASAAIPTLMYVLNANRVVGGPILTKEQLAESMQEEEFRKAVRNAVLRIQGK